jgi:hypothetical protein
MSFDRPGMPHPGHRADEAEIDDDLREEGVELTDGELDGLDHPGGVSRGPEPNPPRRPSHESAQATDNQATDNEASDNLATDNRATTDSPAARAAAEAAEGEPVDDPAHDDPAHDAAHDAG